LKLRPNTSVQKYPARVNVRYCTVRENVVMWVTAPDVAVTVTVEVPVATGADGVDGVDDLVEALHPPSMSMIASRDRVSPQNIRDLRLVLRFVHSGKRPANPRGNSAPTLTI
jgi:hypothetical protein